MKKRNAWDHYIDYTHWYENTLLLLVRSTCQEDRDKYAERARRYAAEMKRVRTARQAMVV